MAAKVQRYRRAAEASQKESPAYTQAAHACAAQQHQRQQREEHRPSHAMYIARCSNRGRHLQRHGVILARWMAQVHQGVASETATRYAKPEANRICDVALACTRR